MALINLLGGNTSGKSLPATAQERVNLYYEVLPQQDKSQTVAYGWPGTVKLSDVAPAVAGARGMYYSDAKETLYIATATHLYIYPYGTAGTSVAWPVGFAPGARNWFAENQNSSPAELLVVGKANGARLRLDTNVISAVTLPTASTTFPPGYAGVAFVGARFVTTDIDGKFYWSDLNNATSWPALNFATAESCGDGLVWCCSYRDNLVLFGTQSIEFWAQSPDLNLPYVRQYVTANVGMVGPLTAAMGDDCIYFVGWAKDGSIGIFRLSGYEVTKISTPDIDRVLAREYVTMKPASPGTTQFWFGYCVGFCGHSFYVLKCLGGIDYSIAYDATTGVWSNLETSGGSYNFDFSSPCAIDASLNRKYRNVLATLSANDISVISDDYIRDTLTIPADFDGADITTSETTGTFQEKTLICPHIFDGGSLNKLRLHRVRLDMENPGTSNQFRVGLSISRDGGKTYGTEMLVDLDTDGGTGLRAEWRRLGIGRDFVFKFRFPDSGKIAIIGAYVETSLANK